MGSHVFYRIIFLAQPMASLYVIILSTMFVIIYYLK